ncbi:MAG: hypothetical protein QM482_00020 [Sulfurospirillum sp.]
MSDKKRENQREEEKPKHKVRAKVEHSFMNFTVTCMRANLKLFAHKRMRAKMVGNR